MSRQTLFSLLFALLLAAGLRAWAVGHMDACDRYLAGDRTLPAVQTVYMGRQPVEFPCTLWFPRQPPAVLVLCLLDAALFVVFLVGLFADRQRHG